MDILSIRSIQVWTEEILINWQRRHQKIPVMLKREKFTRRKEKKRESPISALEEEVHKELLRSKAFELEMNELGREPELDVLMNSLEIAESDVFY